MEFADEDELLDSRVGSATLGGVGGDFNLFLGGALWTDEYVGYVGGQAGFCWQKLFGLSKDLVGPRVGLVVGHIVGCMLVKSFMLVNFIGDGTQAFSDRTCCE